VLATEYYELVLGNEDPVLTRKLALEHRRGFKRGDVAPSWPPSVAPSRTSSLLSAVSWLPLFAAYRPPSGPGEHCPGR
jgi:hypothetical protein